MRLALALVLACSSSQPVEPAARVEEKEVESPPPGRTIPLTGPATEASAEHRRAAVLAVLTDGKTAAELPVASTDEGKAFDPALVDKLAPRPSSTGVDLEMPTVEGALDVNVARRIIRRWVPEMRACYDRAVAKDATLVGDVVLAIEIGGDGRVTKAEVPEGKLAGTPVATCIAKVMRKWAFPKPSDEKPAKVRARLVLEPGRRGE